MGGPAVTGPSTHNPWSGIVSEPGDERSDERSCPPYTRFTMARRDLNETVARRVAPRSISAARALASVVLAAGILLEGFVSASPAQEQSAKLRVGETLRPRGADFSLTFVTVQRDSRCPKDARCIRAGEAVVLFSVRGEDGGVSPLTFDVPPGGGASQSYHGYRIQIVGLDPQAETDVEIPPGDYIAAVAVQKP